MNASRTDAFRVPVVVVIFNRPDETARLIERLAVVKPQVLLVIADGPRGAQDISGVNQARQLFDQLEWKCEVRRNFSEKNLGCAIRVSSGLSWAFSQVSEAIILEDDCLPEPTFFHYAEELLSLYRDDPRIGSIGGTDFTFGHPPPGSSYFFSRYNLFWGWATWSRAWANYRHDIPELYGAPESLWSLLSRVLPSLRARLYWYYVLRQVDKGKINSWGYRWVLSCWRSGQFAVHPVMNMIENAGFSGAATRTIKDVYGLMPSRPAPSPLVHPGVFIPDRERDDVIEDRVFSRSFTARLLWLRRRFLMR